MVIAILFFVGEDAQWKSQLGILEVGCHAGYLSRLFPWLKCSPSSSCVCVRLFAQLCPTLCDPVDCSLPASSAHRILQARILEWVAMHISSGSSRSGDGTVSLMSPALAGGFFTTWASLVAQMVKCLPTMQETQVQSLGREDPLEKEMAIHSSILAWRIPWTEEPGGLQSMGSQRVRHN